jgi:hypothetical protein
VWGATVYLPSNTIFEFKFIRKESDGSVRISSILPAQTVGDMDFKGCVGIGSKQARYNPFIGSAVDFDELALNGRSHRMQACVLFY